MKSTKSHSWIDRLLGSDVETVPPHVFELAPGYLRYACLQRVAEGFEAKVYREVELPAATFSEGPLGGPVRDRALLQGAIEEVLQASQVDPDEASLLLPDAWLRTVSVDLGEDAPKVSRQELMRWRLKPLVPFRVEELRVEGVDVEASEGSRLLVGFAVDQLVREIEQSFEQAGVRLGLITSRGLSLPWALAGPLAEVGSTTVIALLDDGGYSLTVLRDGIPTLVRHRGLPPFELDEGQLEHVRRDLRITRESLGGAEARVLLCSPAAAEPVWLPLLEDGLAASGSVLTMSDLRTIRLSFPLPVETLAPLLGAVAVEIRMSLPVLNLAHRPFLNRKPVKRAQRILWGLIALLLVVNGLLYWKNREDSSDLRDRAREVRRGITDESIVLGQLQDQLGELDPERQNARVDFLNLKIAERTFPWGRLFDRLSSILPPMVRLRTLDPSVGQNSVSRAGAAPGEETVLLAINGVAASDSDLYALIDGFFGHPAFEEPKLRSERTNDNGEVGFSMTVRYHPWIEEPESSAESAAVDQEVAAR